MTPLSAPEKSSDPTTMQPPPPPPVLDRKWPPNTKETVLDELNTQKQITVPMLATNLTWFVKMAITTAFLGRLGKLALAGGALGFTFANVTGFSVLNGLCGAMEPICGQAWGAKNFRLLHKTLLMVISLLLLVTVPISCLWLSVDKILIHFGQQEDMSCVAKSYLVYLLPDLVVTSLLCPLRTYLSSQGINVPTMLSSALALAFHVPVNVLLVRTKGIQGVAMAVWVTDLLLVVLLAVYIFVLENSKGGSWKDGGWFDQTRQDWIRLLKLCAPCCLTTSLEWWCWEILVLLTGRLTNASQAIGVLVIVLNFDYLLFSVMLSLATCASIRVSNELGANQATAARRAACVTLAIGVISGCVGGLVMVGARGIWGSLFSHDAEIIRGVKRAMILMALLEVVNFPVAVSGGIIRGTARPWLAMYANLGGFYLLALPIAVLLAFRAGMGLAGMLIGFLIGTAASLILLIIFVTRIDWEVEANKAQKLASTLQEAV